MFLLAARSSLDIFADTAIHIGALNFNAPALISLLILALAATYFLLKGKVAFPRPAAAFAAWLFFLLISVWLSVAYYDLAGLAALREWVRLLSLFSVFILAYQFTDEKNKDLFINAGFWSLLVPLTLGIGQFLAGGRLSHGVPRIWSTFGHPNTFAYYLVFFIGLTVWRLRFSAKKPLWAALLIAQLLCLGATVSLTGYIMASVFFIWTALKIKRRQRLILGLAALLGVLVLINLGPFQTRLAKIRQADVSNISGLWRAVPSFNWRVRNWQGLIQLWKEKPWLGYGLDSYRLVNPTKTKQGEGFNPHSSYIGFLAETGLLGLAFYLFFLAATASAIRKYYLLSSDPESKWLLLTLQAFFVAWLVGSIAGDVLNATALQFYFWAYFGMAAKTAASDNGPS